MSGDVDTIREALGRIARESANLPIRFDWQAVFVGSVTDAAAALDRVVAERDKGRKFDELLLQEADQRAEAAEAERDKLRGLLQAVVAETDRNGDGNDWDAVIARVREALP